MNEVILLADGEIAANGAWGSGSTVGGTQQVTDNADGFVAFQNARDHWPAGDEVNQAAEKWLAVVFGIVLLSQWLIYLNEFKADNFEAFGFKSGKDGACQAALDTVGLENDERSLHSEKISTGDCMSDCRQEKSLIATTISFLFRPRPE